MDPGSELLFWLSSTGLPPNRLLSCGARPPDRPAEHLPSSAAPDPVCGRDRRGDGEVNHQLAANQKNNAVFVGCYAGSERIAWRGFPAVLPIRTRFFQEFLVIYYYTYGKYIAF